MVQGGQERFKEVRKGSRRQGKSQGGKDKFEEARK